MGDPAEKYADKIDPTHQLAMEMVMNSFHSMKLFEDHLTKVDEAERSSHSFGHIMNPTLYRDQINSKSFAKQMIVIRAALLFIKTISEAA